jgi:hypothetical protein
VWRLRLKYITSTPGNAVISGLRVISMYAIAVALVHANAALGASAMQACCSLACTHAAQADQADQQSPEGITSHDCMHVPVWHHCTCHDDTFTLVVGTSSPHEQFLFHVAPIIKALVGPLEIAKTVRMVPRWTFRFQSAIQRCCSSSSQPCVPSCQDFMVFVYALYLILHQRCPVVKVFLDPGTVSEYMWICVLSIVALRAHFCGQ